MDAIMMLSSQNPKKKAGRKKFKETRHPVYRGVRSRNCGSKWVCEVREPITQTRVWLGTHPTAEMAARAHDVAVLAMRGPSACLNFADSVWRLPIPESSNISDIQKAAAEAAEAFRHTVVVVEIVEKKELPKIVCFVVEIEEVIKEVPEIVCYADEDEDEDEIFGIPGFFASMAQGLMIPPPQNVGYGNYVDNIDVCLDMSLWI